MLFEPALITARVTSVLEKLHVRYLIGGSLATRCMEELQIDILEGIDLCGRDFGCV
jgi:hypothetical protein